VASTVAYRFTAGVPFRFRCTRALFAGKWFLFQTSFTGGQGIYKGGQIKVLLFYRNLIRYLIAHDKYRIFPKHSNPVVQRTNYEYI